MDDWKEFQEELERQEEDFLSESDSSDSVLDDEVVVITDETTISVGQLKELVDKLEELEEDNINEDEIIEEDDLDSEEDTTSNNFYLKSIYEFLTLEEEDIEEVEEVEELGIMDKPIADYTIQETLLLVVVICFFVMGIYATIKKGIPKWR